MSSTEIKTINKIVWLASYPKSGNTWFRAFITALLNDGEIDINKIKTDGLFSSREIFNEFTDLDSTLLTEEETKILQPKVYSDIASFYEKERLFIKIHDSYHLNSLGEAIVPEKGTYCALYFVRNPLDIVASLAHHMNTTIDKAVKYMGDKKLAFSGKRKNLNNTQQIHQLLMNWSEHVESWLSLPPFPVKIIRYEDMVQDSFNTFKQAVDFVGFNFSEIEIRKAIDATSFKNLKKQELNSHFKEVPHPNKYFFRKGTINNWQNELPIALIEEIKNTHHKMMSKLNY